MTTPAMKQFRARIERVGGDVLAAVVRHGGRPVAPGSDRFVFLSEAQRDALAEAWTGLGVRFTVDGLYVERHDT